MKTLQIILFAALIFPFIAHAQSGTWETGKTPMPVEKYMYSSTVANGKIYVMGGAVKPDNNYLWYGVGVNSIEVYDPITDSWDTTKTDMPIGKAYSSIATIDNLLYVFGGWNSNIMTGTIQVYNTETDTWDTSRTPMPTARGGCKATVLEGKIYVAGAWDSDPSIAGCFECYDPEYNRWMTLPDLPEPVGQLSMEVIEGKIYISGGNKYTGSYNIPRKTIQIYDPVAYSWHICKAELTDAYWNYGTCHIEDRIYVLGAMGPLENGDYLDYPIVEVFDTKNNIVFKVSDIPTPRYFCGVHLIDGKIYVIGGLEPGVSWDNYTVDLHTEVEVFTPEVNLTYTRNINIDKKYLNPDFDSLPVQTDFVNDLNAEFSSYAIFTGLSDMATDSVLLYDDGLHDDGAALDGLYGTYISVDTEDEFMLGISSFRADNGNYLIRDDIYRFTSIGPLTFDGFEFPTEDTIPDPGDNFTVYSILRNLGQTTAATAVTAFITSHNDYATVSDRKLIFDDIEAGHTTLTTSRKVISISEDCPDGSLLSFAIDVYSHYILFWQDTFQIKVGYGFISGIEDLEIPKTDNVNIFPNPTSGIINIIGLAEPAEVRVYSIQGQLMKKFSQIENTIDVSDLKSGIYILQLSSKGGNLVRRIVKE